MNHGLNNKTVCIADLGYVELPLALAFSEHLRATNFDVDPGARSQIKAMSPYTPPTPALMRMDDAGEDEHATQHTKTRHSRPHTCNHHDARMHPLRASHPRLNETLAPVLLGLSLLTILLALIAYVRRAGFQRWCGLWLGDGGWGVVGVAEGAKAGIWTMMVDARG